jgi:hypothetical protein
LLALASQLVHAVANSREVVAPGTGTGKHVRRAKSWAILVQQQKAASMLLQGIVLGLWVAIALPAAAQQPAPPTPLSSSLLPCEAFKKNVDGDWVAKRDVMVPGPTGPTQIQAGTPVDEILQDELEHRCK